MIEFAFNTEGLPTEDRLPLWRDMTSKALVPTECVSDVSDFAASLRMVDLTAVQLTMMNLPRMRSYRSIRQIKQSDPEQFQLAIPEHGRFWFTQAGRTTEIGPGDLMLYDSSRPFDTRTRPGESGRCEMLMAQFPQHALRLRPEHAASLSAVRVPAGDGIAAVMSNYLTGLPRQHQHYTGEDASRLGNVTVDLIAAWCAHALKATGALAPETRDTTLLIVIRDFIERHLAEPTLSPQTIAAAHHISTRHLHRLFQQQRHPSVAGWIRHRRLERCRHDLTDPALLSRPVHTIALRWGFTEKSHFSRLFRTAYGTTPRDYRVQMAT